jgi:OmpA-OmpF porin, OOP family
MNRSKLPYIFFGFAAMIASLAVVIFINQLKQVPAADSTTTLAEAPPSQPPAKAIKPSSPPPVLEKPAANAAAATDPAALVTRIATALETGDLSALEPAVRSRLEPLIAAAPLKLREPGGIREIGEIELNSRSRWVLEFANLARDRNQVLLDLKNEPSGWVVEKITLPALADEPMIASGEGDSLAVADGFLAAVLRQDFEQARALIDPAGVSDTKIAGLCILFEEGGYRLRKSKPLRGIYQRDVAAGYLVNIENLAATQAAEFALNLSRPAAAGKWRVSEINLDQLLADYSKRVAGGDLYYSPLVKNPAGGETLALYFEFSEDQIQPRTQRQLAIIAAILKADPGKKITLSGHTDALGSKDYNNGLSSRRAEVVKKFLTGAGVAAGQILSSAMGDRQPRRPNLTEAGSDNPTGRRANRRTEVYLDF